MGSRSVGVEEEFLLVDPRGGEVRAAAARALGRQPPNPDVEVEAELQLQQIETSTEPCETLTELDEQLRRSRRRAADTARAVGVEIAALGTSPLPAVTAITPSVRYQRMRERFGLLAEEQLTCGCHIHVGVESDEEAVAALDRARPWLAPLLALSANSPFWDGRDTRYASYRSRVWSRWPSAGPTELFGSAAVYRDTVDDMIKSATVLDTGMVYFDIRLSEKYPTLEFRVADVCADVDSAVLMAALSRALVRTAVREWRDDVAPCAVRLELLRLAAWRAGRDGLDAALLDPRSWRPAPARQVLDALLEHLRDALDEAGELTEVRERYAALLRRGNGARRQRAVYAESGSFREVVRDAVRRTLP